MGPVPKRADGLRRPAPGPAAEDEFLQPKHCRIPDPHLKLNRELPKGGVPVYADEQKEDERQPF